MERNHDFQAVGLDFQEVELFHSLANSPAADLFDNSNAMIGIDDLIADVEIVAADHKGTPTRAGQMKSCTLLVYPKRTGKAMQKRPGSDLGIETLEADFWVSTHGTGAQNFGL